MVLDKKFNACGELLIKKQLPLRGILWGCQENKMKGGYLK